MWYASTGLWSECAKIFCQIKHAKLSKYSHDETIQFHDNSNDSWKVECETVRWTDSTNYNHTFCQWWLLAVIKNFSQVFIVLAQLLKYLQIDCNILPWHWSPLCYWPFVRGIHWSSMDSPHKRLAAQALIFSLMLAWTNCWTNMPVPGYLTRYDTHVKVFANLLQYLSFTGHARRQKKEDTSQASRRCKGRRHLSSTRRYVMGHVGWWWWCGGGCTVVGSWGVWAVWWLGAASRGGFWRLQIWWPVSLALHCKSMHGQADWPPFRRFCSVTNFYFSKFFSGGDTRTRRRKLRMAMSYACPMR